MSARPAATLLTRMFRALTVVASALLAVLGASAGTADAHSGKQSYLYVSVFDDEVRGRVEMPAADLAASLDIGIPTDVAGARSAVPPLTETIRDYVIAHTSLAGDVDARPWPIDFAERLSILPTENGPYVVIDFVVDEVFDAAPTSFVASFDVIIESNPERDALLIVEDDWASGTFDNGSDPLLGFSVGATEQVVDLGGASVLSSLAAIRGIGTDAVRVGIDLLLIVAGVTLIATTARSEHGSFPSVAGVVRRLFTLLATLVVAATPTLWVAGLGAWSPPRRELGIAVAIALGAVAILVIVARLRTLAPTLMGIAVAAVGLVLGAGLGRFFVDTDLDRRRPVLGLVAFEVGALAAVVLIVACLIGPLLLLRGTRLDTPVTMALGVAILAYAIAWLGERILDTDWPIEEVANPLRVWPRNLWFVATAIGAAALWRRLDRSNAAPTESARTQELSPT